MPLEGKSMFYKNYVITRFNEVFNPVGELAGRFTCENEAKSFIDELA